MAKLKKILSAVLCAAMAMHLTGCWDYHEIEMYSIVSGIAVDKGQNGYKYHVTIEYLNISGDINENQNKALTVEADGDTVFDAERESLKKNDKKFYFSNCKILLISEDIAGDGLKQLLDWFMRDAELRTTIEVVVSKEKTAGEILHAQSKNQDPIAFQIKNIISDASYFDAAGQSLQLYEIVDILNTPGEEVSLPGIRLKNDNGVTSLELMPNAVFKSGRLIGWLSDEQSKYYMFARDRINGGIIVTGMSPGKNDIALEIFKNRTYITPIVEGSKVTVRLDVETTAGYAEENSNQNYLDMYGIAAVEKRADATLKEGITDVISAVTKQYGSDIFGFGKAVYDKYPSVWEKLSQSGGNPLGKMNFEVNTNVKIINTAVTSRKGGD